MDLESVHFIHSINLYFGVTFRYSKNSSEMWLSISSTRIFYNLSNLPKLGKKEFSDKSILVQNQEETDACFELRNSCINGLKDKYT